MDGNGHGLTKENFLRSLPVSISGDPKMVALAQVIAGALERNREEIDRLALYPHIDRLDGELLDILARDFKVDWWDGDYSMDEKRRTLATSWQVHRMLGTKAAVETAVRAVYPAAEVREWFEYGGEPYSFRLDVGLQGGEWTRDRHKQLKERLQYYKNLRSHLETVNYHIPPAVLENHNTMSLAQFSTTLRISSLGEEIILLDGRRSLDGGWLLLQRAKRGVALQSLTLHCKCANRQALAGALLIPGAVRNRQNTAAKAVYSASGMNRQQTHQHHTTAVRAPNPQGLSATLTATVDNRLDGIFMLDGSRKLNSGTSRREL